MKKIKLDDESSCEISIKNNSGGEKSIIKENKE